jgi:hypothetical protein
LQGFVRTEVVIGAASADHHLTMTREQMWERVARAEQLHRRLGELERAHEQSGLYEEALETRRLRHDQQASALYWRSRVNAESR